MYLDRGYWASVTYLGFKGPIASGHSVVGFYDVNVCCISRSSCCISRSSHDRVVLVGVYWTWVGIVIGLY